METVCQRYNTGRGSASLVPCWRCLPRATADVYGLRVLLFLEVIRYIGIIDVKEVSPVSKVLSSQ